MSFPLQFKFYQVHENTGNHSSVVTYGLKLSLCGTLTLT